jgi:hypothetical protein
MEVNMGFDMYPALSEPSDLEKWSLFLEKVQNVCQHDPLLEITENEFKFKVGDNPSLLKNGAFFRRFSSKVTDSTREAQTYIVSIFELAKVLFEGRVFFWSDYGYEDEPKPKYTQAEIDEAREAYKCQKLKA